jgi:peptide/nickel transport system substrate-binding protein
MKVMKRLILLLVIIMLCAVGAICCGSPETTTPSSSVSASIPPTPQQTATEMQPQHGGTLRLVRSNGPANIGYPPNSDKFWSILITDRLIDWDIHGNYNPSLAESWDEDPVNKTLTWHLRKGVTFFDGTDFNADAVKWNIQRLIDLGQQQEAKYIDSMEVVDDYTLRMHLNTYTNQAVVNYGWVLQFSPTAIQKNGEKWAETNSVGVGPFKFVDFKRDDYCLVEKYDNYWRKGTPYLDSIKVITIPDPVTAAAMMEAGEADVWQNAAIQNAVDLENKGLKVNWGIGMFQGLWPNSKNPNSIYTNKKVREALECAINRPGLTQVIGFGHYEPLTQLAPKVSYGYIPGYDPRPYDPAKAKQLLAEAGFPDGFETSIMVRPAEQDIAAIIQADLKAVGIDAKLDVRDPAAFGAIFYAGKEWDALAVAMGGIDADYLTGILRHFGPTPMLMIAGLSKSPEFMALCDKALQEYDYEGKVAISQQLVRQAGEDAMVVPLFRTVNTCVYQKNVHTDYILIHDNHYFSYLDWIEK